MDKSAEDAQAQSPSHRRASSENIPSPRSPRPRVWNPEIGGKPFNTSLQINQSLRSPISAMSNLPFGQLSPGATDRVFPIRSVVSVDHTSSPFYQPGDGGDAFPGMMAADGPSNAMKPQTGLRHFSGTSTSSDIFPDISTANTPSSSRRLPIEGSSSKDFGALGDDSATSEARRDPGQVVDDGECSNHSKQITSASDNASTRSESLGSISEAVPWNSGPASIRSAAEDTSGIFTARFKHVVTEEGHTVITGRDGDTLQRCEDEPIHIPGAVQGFGLLVALHEVAEGKLTVRVVSENSERLIGYTPQMLFRLESFCDILSDEQTDNLLDHLEFIRDEDADPATIGPEVFTLSIRSPKRKTQKLWCAMHISEHNPDLIICEFELEDDRINPLVPIGATTPEPPEDTLQSNPTPEELVASTHNSSKPLRVLRSARKRKGEAAAMEVFNIMSQVQEQLAGAPNLEEFLKVLVGVVKELTGFHRVMVYQFDQAWNGKVVTELVDPRATKDLYKGLNFPASDIPKQARDLYKVNKVRLLYDRDLETARLVCRTLEDLETPVDLTYAYLRAMSPIHIQYLANMAVRSSMSISINAFDELWGLIACHSYGSKGMRVSFPIRKMCRLVGDSASRNIERLSYASRLQARKLINTVPTKQNPSGYIIASSDDLLKLFDADYGLLSIRDETKIMGKLEQTQEALAMLEYFRLRKITAVLTSSDIHVDFPDLRYPPGFSAIAGFLLVPLSVGGNDFIVFFRKGQLREVKWAGNPYEKFIKEGTEGYLEPRKSFKTWSETVVGKSKDWTEEQIETGAVLCLVYGKFIDVWRQKEAALQNSELTRLLLANSAHEVRTPLNAIINYLEIAMEGSLDQETRDNLSKSHSASKSLIYVINDLLDLTKTEQGHNLIKDDVFDLPETVREATDMFSGDAKRKQIGYEVIENPGIPNLVIGDQRRVRQVISNITANAIQHTSSGGVKVELWLVEAGDRRVDVEIVVQDTGAGMSPKKLDALFRELEEVQSESDEGLQEMLAPDTREITQGSQVKRTLGLGLAVVARIVRNMNGQLRLKSEEGKGSRFAIQLSFDLPLMNAKQAILDGPRAAGISPPMDQPTTPRRIKGEVLLVDKSAQKPGTSPREVVRRASVESLHSTKTANSMKSFNSGSSDGKSDVDRLIDAIQEPYMVARSSASTDLWPPRLPGQGIRGDRRYSTSSPRAGLSRRHTGYSGTGRENETSVLKTPQQLEVPGQASVVDSKTPIKPIRVPESSFQGSPVSKLYPRTASRLVSDTQDKPTNQLEYPTVDHLRVLVAEDDPLNSKIIKKRLEKIGHDVYLTINGEECSSLYGERAAFFDVVLMDMQMPIVDGLTSAKLIRSYEKSHPAEILSSRAALNSRVPIFAVSASLIENERQVYIDAGFDGWVLKPIDFKRLSVLLSGLVEENTRVECLYQPGKWERGGWFMRRQPDVYASFTKPSSQAPVTSSRPASFPSHEDDPISREQERLDHLETDAVHAMSSPQDAGTSGDPKMSGL